MMKSFTLCVALWVLLAPLVRAANTEEPTETVEVPLVVEWKAGLVSLDADEISAGDFFLEFHRKTGIPVRLEPGVDKPITVHVKNVGLEHALAMAMPAGGWQIVRKPNRALRADDAIIGLWVRPPGSSVPGNAAGTVGSPRVGGTNYGAAFPLPSPSPAAAPSPATSPAPDNTK